MQIEEHNKLIEQLKDSHAAEVAELAQKIKGGEAITEELEKVKAELEVSTI